MSILLIILLAVVPACGEEVDPSSSPSPVPSASPSPSSSPSSVAQIGETDYLTLDDAVSNATAGDEIKILAAGSYKVPAGKDLTITAEVEGVVFEKMGAYNMKGANVTFNNVTFNWTNDNYKGLQHSGDLVYNNCTINGQPFLYGASETFTGCTFNQTSADAYNVWTYGAPNVTFNDCVFNSAGKAVLIYSESKTLFSEVTFNDCRLIASAPVTGKAAIEMDSSLTAGIKLTITETTATGFDNGNVSGNPLWNNKKGNAGANNDITVIVDGETVLDVFYAAKIGDEKYETLQAAINDAKDETVITLLGNVTEDVTVTQQAGVNFTVDGAGNTLSGVIVVDGKSARYEGAGLTVRNVNFDAEKISADAYIRLGDGTSATRYTNNVAVENCTFSGNGVVAVKSYTGGDLNLTVTGCTVNEGMHSLLQVANVETGLEIVDCEVYSKNGINLNNCPSAIIDGCMFYVTGYAVRAGVNGNADASQKDFTLKNNILVSVCDDGDAVLMLRTSAENANLFLTKNAFSGTTHISGVTENTKVYADENYWGGKSKPVVSGTPVDNITYYYADMGLTQLKLYSEIDELFQDEGTADDLEINDGLPDDVEPIYVPSAETLANDSSERPYADGYVFTGWEVSGDGTVKAVWFELPNFTFDDLVKAYGYLDVMDGDVDWSSASVYDVDDDKTITMSDIILLAQYIADATSQQAKSD